MTLRYATSLRSGLADIEMRITRTTLLGLIICLSTAKAALAVQAGGINWTPIEKIENAPLLAICTVEDITPGLASSADPPRIPQGNYDAQLLVLRSYVKSSDAATATTPQPGKRITLRYEGRGDPPFPASGRLQLLALQKGQVALFPLVPAGDGMWRLAVTNATNLTVPALEREGQYGVQPRTAREFILQELANTLANGSPPQQHGGAVYLWNMPDVPVELRGLVEELLGSDEDRWLQLGATFLSLVGLAVNPPSVVDLVAGNRLPGGSIRFGGATTGLLGRCSRARGGIFRTD